MATERENEVIKAARAVLDSVAAIERDQFEVHVMRRRAGNRFERDVSKSNRLQSRLVDLEAAVQDLDQSTEERATDTSPARAAITTEVDRELAKPDELKALDVRTFFESVSQSLSDAQKALDAHSAEYLQGIAGKPYLAPAVFRMPRLKANITFAMRNITSAGFDIFIASSRKEQEEFQQQAIEFEMVSAPPAVEVLRDFEQLALRTRFLLLGPENARIAAKLEEWLKDRGNSASDRDRALIATFQQNRGDVIVFEASPSTTLWLIARFVRPSGERRLGVWQFDSRNVPPVLNSLIDLAGNDEDPLVAALIPVFDRQKQLLERQRMLSAVLGE